MVIDVTGTPANRKCVTAEHALWVDNMAYLVYIRTTYLENSIPVLQYYNDKPTFTVTEQLEVPPSTTSNVLVLFT